MYKTLFRFIAATLLTTLLANTALAVTISHGGRTVNMDFVFVGNAHNAPDDEIKDDGTTGYGAVGYSYSIGKYEVSNSQWDPVGELFSESRRGNEDQPAVAISWNHAAMFCNWLTSGDLSDGAYAIAYSPTDGSGMVTGIDRDSAVSTYGTVYVIPTEDEWYKAAYYDGSTGTYYDYPTGSDDEPDGIDVDGDTTFDAVFRVQSGYNQGHPNDVGNAGVLSPYGTMGQGGNVYEWNETESGSGRGISGGFWGGYSVGLAASIRC